MSVELAGEIWKLVRESVPYDDREQVADSLVGILVEHGIDAADIKYEFSDDREVLQALKWYTDEEELTDEDDSYSSDGEEEEDW